MDTVILILMCALLTIFALSSFIENAKAKKELKTKKQQEQKNEKINKETIENINAVVSDDVHAGNNVLHQLAEKRK